MSQFHGPQPGYKDTRTRNKGVMRARREQKRLDAELRDEALPADDPKRRAIRLGTGELNLDKPRRRRRNRKNREGTWNETKNVTVPTVQTEDISQSLTTASGAVTSVDGAETK